MRKLVLYLVTVLLLALAAMIVLRGVVLGPIIINSFKEISDANSELDGLIDEAVEQKEVKYTEALSRWLKKHKKERWVKNDFGRWISLTEEEANRKYFEENLKSKEVHKEEK